MNSHQRRTARRHWRYCVNLYPLGLLTNWYSKDLIEKGTDARAWVEANIGKIGYRWTVEYPYRFYFYKSADASVFALRWS